MSQSCSGGLEGLVAGGVGLDELLGCGSCLLRVFAFGELGVEPGGLLCCGLLACDLSCLVGGGGEVGARQEPVDEADWVAEVTEVVVLSVLLDGGVEVLGCPPMPVQLCPEGCP